MFRFEYNLCLRQLPYFPPDFSEWELPLSVKVMESRGVTIYRYIAIHEEFVLYRNTKFVSQYIAIFLYSN